MVREDMVGLVREEFQSASSAVLGSRSCTIAGQVTHSFSRHLAQMVGYWKKSGTDRNWHQQRLKNPGTNTSQCLNQET